MMINLIILFVLIISTFVINYYFLFYKKLNNFKGDRHQKFSGQLNVPLTGGIYLAIFSILFFYDFYGLYILFFLSIFTLGFLSDTKIINSPKKRIIIQILILFLFIYFSDLRINSTRLYFLDYLLSYKLFSILFVIFCISIVINGTNFIDGVNGNVIIYYFLISIFLSLSNLKGIPQEVFFYFSIFLLSLLFLNLRNKLYLGDSGSYLLGFLFSSVLIFVFNENQTVSPFFIILLLWYPCFENLFSITRKFITKKDPSKPDTDHFHQLMYSYLLRKYHLSSIICNNMTGLLIGIYNLIIFLLAFQDTNHTKRQIYLIILSIGIYTYLYCIMKKKLK
jgi:UDP-N-acetylmuramyl pentapeptide phosphotransferase/UDP-N-acetylglucosamine-1-phosphate transferase